MHKLIKKSNFIPKIYKLTKGIKSEYTSYLKSNYALINSFHNFPPPQNIMQICK